MRATVLQFNKVAGFPLGYICPKSIPLDLVPKELPDDGIHLHEWPTFAKVSSKRPLRTSGMMNCCAIIIQTRTKHYMLHLNPLWYERWAIISHLKKHCPEVSRPQTKIFIVPGTSQGTTRTVAVFLEALSAINPMAAKNAQYVRFPDDAIKYKPEDSIDNPLSVVSYDGKLYYMSKKSRGIKFKNGGDPMHPDIHVIDS